MCDWRVKEIPWLLAFFNFKTGEGWKGRKSTNFGIKRQTEREKNKIRKNRD